VFRYVVQPEYMEICNDIEAKEARGFVLDWCKSENVIAVSVVLVLFAAVLSIPMWALMLKCVGKRNTWLAWSFTMACTNVLYFFVDGSGGKEAYLLCFIVSFLNGLPFGAKFLSDAILADVIDYDEFLTGARSEATYMMFKSFLPKIAAIPASAIPIALLGVFGHKPPVDGVIQKQISTCLVTYIRVCIIAIPTFLSVVAFILKLRYPLRTKKQNELVGVGIGQHLAGKSSVCPISGTVYEVVELDQTEKTEAYRLDNFMGLGVAKMATKTPSKVGGEMLRKATIQFFVVFFAVAVSGAFTGIFWGRLNDGIAMSYVLICRTHMPYIFLYSCIVDCSGRGAYGG
jgi:hypothetical protein